MTFLIRSFLAVGLTLPLAHAAVFTASGNTPADIQLAVDNFRAALGANNGVGGSFATGRREINWDGVPDSFSSPNLLPANFFNVNSPRGVVFSGSLTGFAVSADSSNPTVTPTKFGDLNAGYPNQFQTFSAERLFTSLENNIVQIDFFVPGTSTPASVLGFGAVFTDVEVTGGTIFTVFYANGANGGQFAVPTSPSGGLSFLGLTDPANRYSRIIIDFGNFAPGQTENLNSVDVVAMDDFIYGEPISLVDVPEPSSLLLFALGTVAVGLVRRNRK